MLNPRLIAEVREATEAFWSGVVGSAEFIALASGKEIGHRIADRVEQDTVALLAENFPVAHQRGAGGLIRTRGIGDIWVKDQDVLHPINVKSGVAGANGQPNMVSLGRLLDALLTYQIDSYYLLLVKFAPGESVSVVLVDILDYLEFVHFDSGPGQLMLKERQFFRAVEAGYVPPTRSIREKIAVLAAMLEDADKRLIQNRERRQTKIHSAVTAFSEATPLNQHAMGLE